MRKTARIWRRSFEGLEKPDRFGDGWSEIAGGGEEDFLGSAIFVLLWNFGEMGI